jgi:isopenicillin N synthase-like dioxygenase
VFGWERRSCVTTWTPRILRRAALTYSAWTNAATYAAWTNAATYAAWTACHGRRSCPAFGSRFQEFSERYLRAMAAAAMAAARHGVHAFEIWTARI